MMRASMARDNMLEHWTTLPAVLEQISEAARVNSKLGKSEIEFMLPITDNLDFARLASSRLQDLGYKVEIGKGSVIVSWA